MNKIGTDGLFVVIDIGDIIKNYITFDKYYKLYNRFPLKQIIETLLSVPSQDTDFYDLMWSVTEDKLKNDLDLFDTNVLDIFYDVLGSALDEHLRFKFPKTVDYSEYVLDKWLNNTTVVMRRYEYYRLSDIHSLQPSVLRFESIRDIQNNQRR